MELGDEISIFSSRGAGGGGGTNETNEDDAPTDRRPTDVPNAMSILGTTESMLATVVDVPMLNDMINISALL